MTRRRRPTIPDWLGEIQSLVAYSGDCPLHTQPNHKLVCWVTGGVVRVGCLRGCHENRILEAFGRTAADLRPRRRKVAEYIYRDETGRIMGRIVRYVPKAFVKTPGIDVLYRLPELLSAPLDVPVFVVEGEKDADRLAALGLCATTSPYGSKQWRRHYARWLIGRKAIILPDRDEPGMNYALSILATLPPGAARIVRLPGLRHKGDVSDWLDSGFGINDLWALCGFNVAGLPIPPLASVRGHARWGRMEQSIVAALRAHPLARRVLTRKVLGAAPTRAQSASVSRAVRKLIRRRLIAVRAGKLYNRN